MVYNLDPLYQFFPNRWVSFLNVEQEILKNQTLLCHLDAQNFSRYRNKRNQWNQMQEIHSTLQIHHNTLAIHQMAICNMLDYITNDQMSCLIEQQYDVSNKKFYYLMFLY